MTESASIRFPTWLGVVQGGVLYMLYKSYQDKVWPPEWGGLFNAVLLGALLLPFVAYWGQGILGRPALRRLLLGAGILVLGLGAYQGTMGFPFPEAVRPQLASAATFFGLALLVFMLVPLASGWAPGTPGAVLGGWNYPRLFEHAWRNAVITLQALALTCLFWMVLSLGAQLFQLIGAEWPGRIIRKAWFAIPVTTLSIALGLRSGLRRASFAVSLRNHWLTLTVWLLPVASLIGVAFVLTSLAGVGRLFERGLSAFFLLWFAAFWVTFYNSAFQDGQGEPALHPFLRRVLPFAALALLVVVVLAGWALALRIHQYGLTPDRIWGVLAGTVALAYGGGYALSLRSGSQARWMSSIAPANLVATLVMSVGIVLLLSPAFDANRLATASQMAHLQDGRIPTDQFDVRALVQQGRPGHDALVELRRQRDTDGKPTKLALRAEDAFSDADLYRRDGMPDESGEQVAVLTERIDSYPAGEPLPVGFADFLDKEVARWEPWQRDQSCFEAHARQRCALLQVDLDRDGQAEAVLWKDADDYQPAVYAKRQGQWRAVGHLVVAAGDRGVPDSVRAELASREYAAVPLLWDALRVGSTRFQVVGNAE